VGAVTAIVGAAPIGCDSGSKPGGGLGGIGAGGTGGAATGSGGAGERDAAMGSRGAAAGGAGGTDDGLSYVCAGSYVPGVPGGGSSATGGASGAGGASGGTGGASPEPGTSATCVVGQTYCLKQGPHPIYGGPIDGRCKDLPPSCQANPSCACVTETNYVNCTCRGTDGMVTVYCEGILA